MSPCLSVCVRVQASVSVRVQGLWQTTAAKTAITHNTTINNNKYKGAELYGNTPLHLYGGRSAKGLGTP